jgi:hypothetical protein
VRDLADFVVRTVGDHAIEPINVATRATASDLLDACAVTRRRTEVRS